MYLEAGLWGLLGGGAQVLGALIAWSVRVPDGVIAAVSGLSALLGYVALGSAPPEVIAVITAVAAGAILTMIADTMIPEAFETTRTWTGLITTIGFLVAFAIERA